MKFKWMHTVCFIIEYIDIASIIKGITRLNHIAAYNSTIRNHCILFSRTTYSKNRTASYLPARSKHLGCPISTAEYHSSLASTNPSIPIHLFPLTVSNRLLSLSTVIVAGPVVAFYMIFCWVPAQPTNPVSAYPPPSWYQRYPIWGSRWAALKF